jgi:hypothetical protein
MQAVLAVDADKGENLTGNRLASENQLCGDSNVNNNLDQQVVREKKLEAILETCG